MEKYSRVYAKIDLDAVTHNFREMRKNISPDTKMIAVIKADGYGHGAVPIGKLVQEYDYIWGFAAATAEEAFTLRRAGLVKPILILGYVFEEHYEELVRQDIRPAVFHYEMAKQLSDEACRQHKCFAIHLALDTGMTRIGFKDDDRSLEEIKKISKLPGIQIEGMFTHFARADETDKTSAKRQLSRYQAFADRLEQEGVKIPIRHCSNSAGIIEIPEANLNIVRAGITIYGIYPSDEVVRSKVVLHPVMELKSHISYIKMVDPGVEVSYGGTYVTSKPTRIATIPVGYADGYPRLLSNKGWVLIHGKKAPILGRVCMDQFMVDVTDIPEAEELDEVTLLGRDGEAFLPVETLSELSGRFPYEFVCDISKRVPRVYIKDGVVSEQKDFFHIV